MTARVNRLTILAFAGPAVAALAAVGIAPMLYALWKSFNSFNLTKANEQQFVGLGNYFAVLTDPVFWQSMGRTALLFFLAVPLEILFGLGIALVLHKPGLKLFKTLTRLSLVLPMATTYAVVGLLAQVMFNIKYGVINQFLGFLGIEPINWIGDPTNAYIAVVFWDVWQWTPFVALVMLASLTNVPAEIEEAAQLETKSWMKVLWYVQLPFLVPGLVAVLILRTADTLKLFDMVFTMTRGGPGSATEFIAILIERTGNRQFDIGMASAQSVILLITTIVLARLYIRFFYREAT